MYCFFSIAFVLLASTLNASLFDSTRDLPIAVQGRIRSLEAAAKLWEQELQAADGALHPLYDGSPLTLLWIAHFAEQPDLNRELYEIVEAQRLAGLTPKQIAQNIQIKYPFSERMKNAGTTMLVLPSRLKDSPWISLHALALKIYDPETGHYIYPKNFTRYTDEEFEQIRSAWFDLNQQFIQHKQAEAAAAAQKLSTLLLEAYSFFQRSAKANYPPVWKLRLETLYYRLPLVQLILCFYALSLLLIFTKTFMDRMDNIDGVDEMDINPVLSTSSMLSIFSVSKLFLITGFLLHSALLVLRMVILGRPPVANMFETVIYVPWIALALGFASRLFMRSYLILAAAAAASFLLLFLLKMAYADPHLENVQAVLNSPYWLTVHVLMVVGSYGAFALSGVLGHYYLFIQAFTSKPQKMLSNLSAQAILYTMYAGLTLLIPGTILGGVWAAESWGRFWDWDPKESWAFISACTYLLIVHAYRFRKIADLGLAVGSIIGLMAISFTWYGVNYILGTGLHSYGFGNGGEWIYFLYLLAELLFISITTLQTKSLKKLLGLK